MDEYSSSFTFPRREFLHRQLDEVIRLWHRGSGQGTFFFSVNEGNPNLQYGIQLDFTEIPVPGDLQHPQHHPHKAAARRRGPARKARDRTRAAKYQAAKAATAASPDESSAVAPTAKKNFPGVGKVVGSAAKPVLPLPLSDIYAYSVS